MRDLLLFSSIVALTLVIPGRPYIGALAWVVFSVMNPHRLTWGAAYNFPFAQVIAILTMASMLFGKSHRGLKGGAAGAVLLIFFVWLSITTAFAFESDKAVAYMLRVFKTFLMTGVLLLLLHTKRHVELLIWTLVVSLGFFGVKGGIFTILTGGSFMVNGPPGSVMEGNNSLGVGLVAVIPLMMLLRQQYRNFWIKSGLLVSVGLSAIAVLGTYSRGAFLAIAAMACLLWLRSRQKPMILLMAIAFIAVAVPSMPEQWTARMNTIETYDEDLSARGRLVAWETAYNIAVDRFPVAGGFEWEGPEQSRHYSPVPTMVLVAHSIYFEVIGSQGFIGLALYLLFWLLVWWQCASIRRRTRNVDDLQWAFSTASMIQVSLIGYLVGGAFLNLAFWDLPYYLFAIVGVTRYAVDRQFETGTARQLSSTPSLRQNPDEQRLMPDRAM